MSAFEPPPFPGFGIRENGGGFDEEPVTMELTILGSGGCMVIPKPCCGCGVCEEARARGAPFARTGPSVFFHDIRLLIDTPAEIAHQLNRERIEGVDHILFTHLDPDHVEGFRVVEQIALDFRTWEAYPEKRIRLLLPRIHRERIRGLRSAYGPLVDFYEAQGFIEVVPFVDSIEVEGVRIRVLPIDRGDQVSSILVFEKGRKKWIYAPCDVKPFPEDSRDARDPDLLVIQPGLFETGLEHGFVYPEGHVSRSTLYTFEETLELSRRIGARRVVFCHLEEYWNRSHGDYRNLEKFYNHVRFAHDGMQLTV